MKGIATIHKINDKSIYTYEFDHWLWEDEFLVFLSNNKRIMINRHEIDTLEIELAIK